MRGWIASVVLTNEPSKLLDYFACPAGCASSKCYFDSL